MLFPFLRGLREAEISRFEADLDSMNDFVTAFGNISRGRELAAGLTAFNMLSHAASFKNRAAANGVLDALSAEYALPPLPVAARASMLPGRNSADTGKTGRDLLSSTSAVFFSLVHPSRPEDLYVAGLLRKGSQLAATPVFFMAKASERADTQTLMARALPVYHNAKAALA